MKRTVMFFAEGFETVEALMVVDILRRGGVEVVMTAIGEEEMVYSAQGIGVEMDATMDEIDVLELYIHVGAYDPADGAVLYGRANALAAAVWLPLNQAFRIREGRVRVDWDPLAEKLVCAGQLALSLRIGEILWIGLRFGVKALAGFLRYRRLKRKAV